MTVELTNEEKAGIVQQHLKNLAYNKYNLEMTIAELNAITPKNQSEIDEITAQISAVDLKIAALTTELTSLQA